MAICSAIEKYTIENFTLYILETHVRTRISDSDLSERENYWHKIIAPTYNIQSIVKPFSGTNHYRFGKKVPLNVREKIGKALKGRVLSVSDIAAHIKGARKKSVYCYDFNT
jgi:hypothetical protein